MQGVLLRWIFVQSSLFVAVGKSIDMLEADYDDDDLLHYSKSSILNSKGDPVNGEGHVKLDYEMRNVTKFRTQQVRLRCEISGNPVPDYLWFKEEEQLSDGSHNGRFIIRRTAWGSRLRLDGLRVEDSGVYKCKGFNNFGEVWTSGFLTVMNEDPPPEERISKSKDDENDDENDLSVLLPDEDGDDFGGFKGKYDTNLLPKKPDGKEKSVGYCQVYRGSTCSKFVGNRSIYVQSKFTQGLREGKFIAAFAVLGSSIHLSKRCQDYGIPSLCYHAFPLCDERKERPRQICRDECEMLENDVCKTEYMMAKRHRLIGDSLLPNCARLKGPGTDEGDNCMRVHVSRSGQVKDEECYNGSGQGYLGRVSRTKSGATCQPWTVHSTQTGSFSAAWYTELSGGHNNCRNPGNTMTGPWCFTSGEYENRELCDVPACVSKSVEGSKLMFILVPSITIPLALFILLVIVCFCQRRSRVPRRQTGNTVKAVQPVEMSPLNPKLDCRLKEVPNNRIKYLRELGVGTYGKVYVGEVMGLYGENTLSKVAIKTLMENSVPKTQSDFRREVDLLSDMRHPNVVCLVGVCLRHDPKCMLFDYMMQGDLHEYLLVHSPHSDIAVGDRTRLIVGVRPKILEYPEMLYISTQVAAGMEYLASHVYVHRDLATRNILVGDNLSIKVSDLGLSQGLYSSDYYHAQCRPSLPIRWMSPESITCSKFSTESDVWSFGVVLWEVFSYGLQPYCGYTNQEVIDMVRSRHLLPQPDDCPGRIFSLMVECWNEMPVRRPTFSESHARLRGWQSELVVIPSQQWPFVHQNQSGNSSSTQQSLQSHLSHPSSTGPSNNTALTGLTGSSNVSDPTSVNVINDRLVDASLQLPGGIPGQFLGVQSSFSVPYSVCRNQLDGGGNINPVASLVSPSRHVTSHHMMPGVIPIHEYATAVSSASTAFVGALSKPTSPESSNGSKSSRSGASSTSGCSTHNPFTSLPPHNSYNNCGIGNGGLYASRSATNPLKRIITSDPSCPVPITQLPIHENLTDKFCLRMPQSQAY